MLEVSAKLYPFGILVKSLSTTKSISEILLRWQLRQVMLKVAVHHSSVQIKSVFMI